jgi:hypothetical protein
MNMKKFVEAVADAADGQAITLLPISECDKKKGCVIRFKLGPITEYPRV